MTRVICACLLLLSACGDQLGEPRDVETRSLSVTATDALHIRVGAGRLEVFGDPDVTEVSVLATVRTLLPDSPKKDQNALDDLTFELGEVNGDLELLVSLSDAFTAWFVDVQVVVPAAMAVRVDDGAGDLVVTGVGAVVLDDDAGDAEVTIVAGDVTVTDGSGTLLVRDVGGNVSVVDDSGGVSVVGVSGDVRVLDTSGAILIERVEGHVEIDDTSGDIELTEVASARVRDGSGDIYLNGVGTWELAADDDGEVFGE